MVRDYVYLENDSLDDLNKVLLLAGREFGSKEEIIEAAERGCVKFFNVSFNCFKDALTKSGKEVTSDFILTLAVLADEEFSLVSEQDRILTKAYRLEHPGNIY